MDTDSLKTFVGVYRAGGFSHAEETLLRSQPAISRRIALLERELKAPLFERTSSGIVLSQAGKVLLPFAERVLAALSDATEAVAALEKGSAGPIALALVGTLASTQITPLLADFARAFPRVALALRTATSSEVSELVRRGEASIGLRYVDDEASDLVCEKIGDEALVVACARRHPLAGKSVASLKALRDAPWVAFPLAPGRREASAQVLHVQFLMRGVADLSWTPVDSLTAQKRLVEAGFGLALLPESAIAEEIAHSTLATIAVRDLAAANPIYAIVRKNGYLSPAALALLARIKGSDYSGRTQSRRRPRS